MLISKSKFSPDTKSSVISNSYGVGIIPSEIEYWRIGKAAGRLGGAIGDY